MRIMRSTGAPVAIGRTPPLTLRFGRTFWLINPVAQGYVAIIFAIAGDRHDEKKGDGAVPSRLFLADSLNAETDGGGDKNQNALSIAVLVQEAYQP